MTLPKELIAIATKYRGPGCVVYAKRMDPPVSEERMDELVAQGWLTKSMRAYDNKDEEVEAEQDPETGRWWFNGNEIPPHWIETSYLTTEQVHNTRSARIAMFTKRMARTSDGLKEMTEVAKVLELDEAFTLRCQLAKLALAAPMHRDALIRHVKELQGYMERMGTGPGRCPKGGDHEMIVAMIESDGSKCSKCGEWAHP